MDAAADVWSEVISLMFIISAAIMWGIWLIERKHSYLLILGTAAAIVSCSFLAAAMPISVDYQVALTSITFIVGLFLAQEGVARRGTHPGTPVIPLVVAATGICGIVGLALTGHGHQLAWQVHIQDVTVAALSACALYRRRMFSGERRGDRLLAVTVLATFVYFLVRSWVGLDRDALWSGQRPGFAAFTPPFVIAWAALVIVLVTILAVQELWDYFDALRRERDTDVLTGVLNRRGFQAKVEQLLASTDRTESTLLVFDLDKFKPVNDRLGHAAGDDVLRNFATVMQSSGRRTDVVGRLGGDEFAVFLDGATYADALHVGQRIRRELARASFNHFAETAPVTVSFGIATASPHTALADVISAADAQLRRAKKRAAHGA
ncbi:hypothetical protein BOO86_25420 [Mycobacterium sp. CBMA 234]|uniref:GGDEF domain-containing protein n=1 Tax=Mycolicibacterium sp. CBMA 234 TaxID=1918495 RepID=UPI0012DE088E|nr:GGDEF domain-containing protein [Mycolicibacterium sp. CBMA 234]MUL67837.1 hypothetical protein [Mycolicibacterium sp. CBMA 234]